MELDKIPGFWTVTGFLDSGVVLRLRIDYSLDDEPELFCEVRLGRLDNFQLVGKATSHAEYILFGRARDLFDGEDEKAASLFEDEDGPKLWKEEFREMARRWAVTCYVLEPGSARIVRYPFEPESSRDALFTGEAYSQTSDAELRQLEDGD